MIKDRGITDKEIAEVYLKLKIDVNQMPSYKNIEETTRNIQKVSLYKQIDTQCNNHVIYD